MNFLHLVFDFENKMFVVSGGAVTEPIMFNPQLQEYGHVAPVHRCRAGDAGQGMVQTRQAQARQVYDGEKEQLEPLGFPIFKNFQV